MDSSQRRLRRCCDRHIAATQLVRISLKESAMATPLQTLGWSTWILVLAVVLLAVLAGLYLMSAI
jgi:hypothetical protein